MLDTICKNWKPTAAGLVALIPGALAAFGHPLTPEQATLVTSVGALGIGLFAQDGSGAKQ